MKCIELTRGFVAIVDDDDFERLAQWRWYYTKKGARRTSYDSARKATTIRMHREVMGASDPKVYVDHINRNPLDNRKSNLRLATHAQNGANSKVPKNNVLGVKGVNARPRKDGSVGYRAHITVCGKVMQLGTFNTVEEASQKYFEAAQAHFGEFARLN